MPAGFTSSDQLVRFAGLDVTVYSSDGKRSPGHLSRQGSPELRWAAFEAAKCAARRGSPDYAYYHKLAANATATTARTRPWRWSAKSCAAAITRCANSAMPPWRCRSPTTGGGRLNALRACPAHKSADACGQLPQDSCRHPALWVDFPERMSGRTSQQPARRAPHPSSCRRTSSVDPDKAGRRHAQRVSRTTFSHGRQT